MEKPISRIYACYRENPENPNSAACIAAAEYSKTALYDWNGVRIGDADGAHRARISNGQLCSAGDVTFSAIDAPRNDWPATSITPNPQGNLDLTFHATAKHATDYIRLYITDQGYDPTQPLAWSTLEAEPFCELSSSEIVTEGDRYKLSCPFPTGLSGRHLIYAIWQRSDSPEAFYACSDVVLDGDVPDPGEPTWQDLGTIIASTDLEAGSKVTLRLFGENGNDEDQYDIVVDAVSGKKAAWPYEMAQFVNAESAWLAIGVLDSTGTVTPRQSATANHVYTNEPGDFSFVIDITAPDPDPDPAPGDSWNVTATYVAGDRVTYQSVEYEAKWWTRGDVPGASAPWKRITAADGPVDWNAGAMYEYDDDDDIDVPSPRKKVRAACAGARHSLLTRRRNENPSRA
ncbi:MAG: lytic polysaccharide monooxygenase, partial [Pseudomonadota bacterium]